MSFYNIYFTLEYTSHLLCVLIGMIFVIWFYNIKEKELGVKKC